MIGMRFALVAGLCIAIAGCSKPREPAADDGRASNAQIDGVALSRLGDGSDWAAAGYNYAEQRFSPLTQINADNVATLGLAWSAELPDARGQEATPIVIDGKMFVSGPWSKVFAFDAATGQPLWTYDPKVAKAKAAEACCDAVNRGVAAWQGRIYVGALDGRLIALNADTGQEEWSVQTTDLAKPYTITGVPRIVKGLVIIGNGGAEFGVRGYVTAYDANTGAQRWRFYTVPNPTGVRDGAASDNILAAKAQSTWSQAGGQWKQSGGGGTVWDAIVYDAELDQLYIGVGNGNPWNHGLRSQGQGDNLFLSSIVALKPETGRYLWHYQETPAENWDFTATQPIVLATIPVDGKPRKVLMQAPKNGFFFVIDRATGKLIDASKFVSNVNWASGYDRTTGRPIENPVARYDRTGKPFVATIGAGGAHNWHPMSFNPTTGLVYIPAQNFGALYLPPQPSDRVRQPIGYNLGVDVGGAMFPRDKAVVAAASASITGELIAWDPVARKARWSIRYPTAGNGGTMTTAGNLVFQGIATGEFRAYAADTGKRLFSFPTRTGVMAGASTYSVDGVQYVAVVTGRGGAFPLTIGYGIGPAEVPNEPRVLVFKLGGKERLPPAVPATTTDVALPPATGTADQIANGRRIFGRYCQVCHGANARGTGVIPNLQHSGTLADADTWRAIVIDGMLKDNGMVSFARVMSPENAQDVRRYVIDEARWAKANGLSERPKSR